MLLGAGHVVGGVRGVHVLWRSGDGDVEGTPGDALVPPLDDEDVAALLSHGVGDVVLPVSCVFDVNLIARRLWPVDADHQHVGSCGDRDTGVAISHTGVSCPSLPVLTCFAAVHCEGVLTHEGSRQPGAAGNDFTGV